MSNPRKVAYITLGCKLNFTETASISNILADAGYIKVNLTENPEIVVVNTCSVTGNADAKCKQMIGRIKKTAPDAKIVATGCYAQLKPEQTANIPGVDLVLGNAEKFDLPSKIADLENNVTSIDVGNINAANQSFIASFSTGDRTRSFLKIQDGCNYFCSYCTIPFARGRSRSDTIDNVIRNIHTITKNGTKEIVLTGINIGHFGEEHNESLLQLMKEIENTDIQRVRISSIEPNLVSREMIEFIAQSNIFLPHFHLPLQSGSNKVLKAMNRKYTVELFENKVAEIKQIMPDACVASDIITGFPSETDEDFDEICKFIERIPLSYLHVFTYSEREGTKALNIENPVYPHIRKKRSDILHQLSDKKKLEFYNQNKNTLRNVLFESKNDKGYLSGFTENYVRVRAPFSNELINKIVNIRLKDFYEDFVFDCDTEIS